MSSEYKKKTVEKSNSNLKIAGVFWRGKFLSTPFTILQQKVEIAYTECDNKERKKEKKNRGKKEINYNYYKTKNFLGIQISE